MSIKCVALTYWLNIFLSEHQARRLWDARLMDDWIRRGPRHVQVTWLRARRTWGQRHVMREWVVFSGSCRSQLWEHSCVKAALCRSTEEVLPRGCHGVMNQLICLRDPLRFPKGSKSRCSSFRWHVRWFTMAACTVTYCYEVLYNWNLLCMVQQWRKMQSSLAYLLFVTILIAWIISSAQLHDFRLFWVFQGCQSILNPRRSVLETFWTWENLRIRSLTSAFLRWGYFW